MDLLIADKIWQHYARSCIWIHVLFCSPEKMLALNTVRLFVTLLFLYTKDLFCAFWCCSSVFSIAVWVNCDLFNNYCILYYGEIIACFHKHFRLNVFVKRRLVYSLKFIFDILFKENLQKDHFHELLSCRAISK